MKHNYHERKDARINYALDKAGANKSLANSFFKRSQENAKHIPVAQPVNSSDIDKIQSAMQQSVATDKKAEYYAEKAKAIEDNDAISSDDPDAIVKLEHRLKNLEKHQEFMKQANKCIKKKDKAAFLKLEGASEQLWIKLITPDFINRTGYPTYKLTNNNANIRRIKERLKVLKEVSSKSTNEKIIKGVRVIENVEANRIQLIFPVKPSKEVRTRLKKEFRFIWCPSEDAWQRFLNRQSIWAAEQFLETYIDENASEENTSLAA